MDILELVTQEEPSNEDESSSEFALDEPKVSSARATTLLSELRQFVQQQDNMSEDVFKTLNYLEDYCESKILQIQAKITDFLINSNSFKNEINFNNQNFIV